MIPTADVTGKELAAARETAGFYQYQVAQLISTPARPVTEDVISNWERGKAIPHPDQVKALERLYKAPGLWHGWMRYQFQSYRETYPDSPENTALALSMINGKYQVDDMLQCQDAAIRDALDGKIDDRKAFAEYIRQAKEAHAALVEMLARAEMEGPHD